MVIKSLKLKNYRRFESLDLEFPENLIGIIGRNGTGKSTLIEAMGWVLYGNRFVRTDKQDVRSQHLPDAAACEAEMIFTFGGVDYQINRKLKGKNATSEAAVYRIGSSEPAAVQDRGVNEFIESLLQLDYRSFTTSVFAQQKELAKLSSLQPEQRRQAINRLINIDRIDRARDEVRRDRNAKQDFLKGVEATLKDLDELKTELKTTRQLYEEKTAKLTMLQKNVDAALSQLGESRSKLDALTELRDQFISLQNRIEQFDSRRDENQKSLQRGQEDLRQIEQSESTLNDLKPQLDELENVQAEKEKMDESYEKYHALNTQLKQKDMLAATLQEEQTRLRELGDAASRAAAQQNVVSELDEKIKSAEADVETWQRKRQDAYAQRLTVENQGKETKSRLDKVTDLGPDGECPVCTQRLGDHYQQVIGDFETRRETLLKEYQTLKTAETEAAAKVQEFESLLKQRRAEKEKAMVALNRAQEAQKQAQQINERISKTKTRIADIEAAIARVGAVDYDAARHKQINQQVKELLAIDKKAAGLAAQVERKAAAEDYIRKTQALLAELEADRARVAEEQKKLKFDENEFIAAKKAVQENEKQLDAERETKNQAERDAAVLKQQIDGIQKEIGEQERLRGEMQETREELDYLNALDDHFGKFRLELAGRIRPLIAERASELLSLTTLTRYSTLELDEDYNIYIYDGNQRFTIERFSGGEQDLANLCLRIAISQVVAERSGGAPINFIVLDEIFGSQDAERRDLILNALGKLATQFRQIFIITHIDTIKDILPVILMVEAVDQNVSRTTLF